MIFLHLIPSIKTILLHVNEKGLLWLYLQAGYMLYDRVLRPAEVGVTHVVEENKTDE